jgi:tetratricopeptide (TPR) repeat protein
MFMRNLICLLTFVALVSGCAVRSGETSRNFQRGNRFLKEGLPQMAVQSYTRALEKHPERAEIWFNMGVAHLRAGSPEEAAKAFRQSVKLKPDAKGWYNLGVAALEADNPSEAATALSQSAAMQPNHTPSWRNLGIAYRRLGRYQLAEESFRKSLSIKKDDPETMNNLAWLYLDWKQGGPANRGKALELAKQAAQINGRKDPRILATLAEAYFVNGQMDAAVQTMERAILVEPQNPYYKKRLEVYQGKKTQ